MAFKEFYSYTRNLERRTLGHLYNYNFSGENCAKFVKYYRSFDIFRGHITQFSYTYLFRKKSYDYLERAKPTKVDRTLSEYLEYKDMGLGRYSIILTNLISKWGTKLPVELRPGAKADFMYRRGDSYRGLLREDNIRIMKSPDQGLYSCPGLIGCKTTPIDLGESIQCK